MDYGIQKSIYVFKTKWWNMNSKNVIEAYNRLSN